MGRHSREIDDRIRQANLEEMRQLQIAQQATQQPVPFVFAGAVGPVPIQSTSPLPDLARALFVQQMAKLADPTDIHVRNLARECIEDARLFQVELQAVAEEEQRAAKHAAAPTAEAEPSLVLP